MLRCSRSGWSRAGGSSGRGGISCAARLGSCCGAIGAGGSTRRYQGMCPSSAAWDVAEGNASDEGSDAGIVASPVSVGCGD